MEEKEHYKAQLRLSTIETVVEVPDTILLFVSAVASGTLIVWLDFIDCLFEVLTSVFVALLSIKLKKNLKYKYNYGIDKIESIGALFCDALLIGSMLLTMGVSCMEITDPSRPSDVLGYVVLLKIVNIAFDAYYLVTQYKICGMNRNRMTVSELGSCWSSLLFDVSAFLVIIICFLFRDYRFSWYVSPVGSILLAGYVIYDAVNRVRVSIQVLTDITLPEEEQMKILKTLTGHYDDFLSFEAVNSKSDGESAQIDLKLKFSGDTTYDEIMKLRDSFSREINESIPGSRVNIIISGDETDEDDEE